MGIFKACDVRGIYPDEVNEEKLYRIGRAVATIIESGPVIVGGDVRISTESLRIALVDGLRHSGSHVIDVGVLPTPALYYARELLGVNSALMITASHNPPDYNGVKIVLGELPITEHDLRYIEHVSNGGTFTTRMGDIELTDVSERYEDYITKRASALLEGIKPLPRVVVDCGNGSYSDIAPRVLKRLRLDRIKLFCEQDGTFPDRSPNCADPKALQELCKSVVKEKADLGVAFDGDGDRIAFVDEKGNVLSAEQFISVMAVYGAQVGSDDKVVLDIKTGTAAIQKISQTGAQIIIERSGHTFLKTRMLREKAAFGGEVSGHLFHGALNATDDSLYSAVMMASIVARYGKLSELAAELPLYEITPDLRIKVENSSGILQRISEAFEGGRVSHLDGVRVEFDDGWGLARASVTEPAITLRFESRTQQGLETVIERFLSPVPEVAALVRRRLHR